jgi:Glyoxalase-like domain
VAAVLTEIVVPCREPAAVAAFWAGALGWSVQEYPGGVRWMSRSGSSDGDVLLVFAPGRQAGASGAQVRLALRPVGCATEDEVKRLVALGARSAGDGSGAPGWVSLTDPEGNAIILGPPLDPASEPPSS